MFQKKIKNEFTRSLCPGKVPVVLKQLFVSYQLGIQPSEENYITFNNFSTNPQILFM